MFHHVQGMRGWGWGFLQKVVFELKLERYGEISSVCVCVRVYRHTCTLTHKHTYAQAHMHKLACILTWKRYQERYVRDR